MREQDASPPAAFPEDATFRPRNMAAKKRCIPQSSTRTRANARKSARQARGAARVIDCKAGALPTRQARGAKRAVGSKADTLLAQKQKAAAGSGAQAVPAAPKDAVWHKLAASGMLAYASKPILAHVAQSRSEDRTFAQVAEISFFEQSVFAERHIPETSNPCHIFAKSAQNSAAHPERTAPSPVLPSPAQPSHAWPRNFEILFENPHLLIHDVFAHHAALPLMTTHRLAKVLFRSKNYDALFTNRYLFSTS